MKQASQQALIDSIIEQRSHIMNTLIDIYNRDHACGGMIFFVNHRVIEEAVDNYEQT